MSRRTAARLSDVGVSLALALVVFGPLLIGPGYWLAGDLVFVPHQPWKPAWLGLDGSLPRAVPMDALVSALTHVVPGSVVERVFLVGSYVLGGVGAGRVVGEHRGWARAAAITLFCWNPWVLERLEIGQWAILAGYFALPWVLLSARRMRHDVRTGWPFACVALTASAVCSPSSGLMAVLALAVLAVRRTWSSWLGVLGLGLLANLPWVLPTLVAARSSVSSVTVSGVFGLFAARGESPLGLAPSLLSMGGIWKTSVVPAERTSAVLVLMSCAVTVVALLGLRTRRARQMRGARSEHLRLAVLAVVSLVLASLPALPGGAHLLEDLGDVVPATALLRDSQRFLAPAVLLLLPGIAAAAAWCRDQVAPGREAAWALVGLLVVAPVVLLPSLAWGGLGDLQRSTYPADWQQVADRLDAEPGTTVVLPWLSQYRGFDWTHHRAVLDPAPRFMPGTVLVDDRLFVDDAVVPSEDPQVQAVTTALAAPDPAASLRALGVRWVLVEKVADDTPAGPVPDGVTVVDGDQLRLLDLGSPSGVDAPGALATARSGYTQGVIAGDVAVYVLFISAIVYIFRQEVTRVTTA